MGVLYDYYRKLLLDSSREQAEIIISSLAHAGDETGDNLLTDDEFDRLAELAVGR